MSPVDRETSAETLESVVGGNQVAFDDLTGRILGDFQVERLLGRGGMGEVYLATQITLKRPVALKVLRPDCLSKGAYLSRFKTEATTIAKLNHPSIVHVYTIGDVDQKIHFIAMEYVEGTNLREYIRRKGALDVPLALSIMRQAAQAIGAAGEEGVIHRDVKPENILVTRRGRVKVADFGLCRDIDAGDLHVTQEGVTVGTPLYMSPEQVQGHSLDHRSDLYSLGVTFYHMLAGVPPFEAETAVALALKHVREIPRSLLIHRPDLPIELDRIVMKLMAKDPGSRFQSAAELLAELSKVRDAVQAGTTAVIPETGNGPLARTEPTGSKRAHNELVPRGASSAAAGLLVPTRPITRPDLLERDDQSSADATEATRPGGFRVAAALLVGAVGLLAGGLAGWSTRAPDVLSLPVDSSRSLPALWLEPRWTTIPRQPGAEEQLRYAQFRAPSDEWIAAWLAVPGNFPHSHDSISKAYLQLARLWFRSSDPEALSVLASELTQWKEAQARDQELADVVRLAIMLKKGDLDGAAKGFAKVTQAEVTEIYDPALIELNLEVCSAALQAVSNSGTQAMAEPFRKAIRNLAHQLYRIEAGDLAGTGRLSPAARAALKKSR
jgi:serine/threonine-protein kinase